MNRINATQQSPQFSVETLFPGNSVEDLLCHKLNFSNYINKFYTPDKIETLVAFLDAYFQKYPLFRVFLPQIYEQCMVEAGDTKLAFELARIYAETTDRLLKIGTDRFGIPAIFEATSSVNKISEIVWRTAYVSFIAKLGLLKEKPILCLENGDLRANAAFAPYLEDVFTVIKSEDECRQYSQLIELAPLNTTFYKFSDTIYGHNKDFFGDLYSELVKREIDLTAFKLKQETSTTAKKFLKKYGLNKDDDFVVVHLKEITENSSSSGNVGVNPFVYLPAIDWLISSGFKVVRIGHSKMTELPPRKGLIDLTSVERPGEVDIFLCAKAHFFYGTPSGPYSLAVHFGTSSLLTSVKQYGLCLPNTMIQLTPLVKNSTGQIMKMKDISNMGLFSVRSETPFLRRGLSFLSIGSEENLKSVKDMVTYLEAMKTNKMNSAPKTGEKSHKFECIYTSDTLNNLF